MRQGSEVNGRGCPSPRPQHRSPNEAAIEEFGFGATANDYVCCVRLVYCGVDYSLNVHCIRR